MIKILLGLALSVGLALPAYSAYGFVDRATGGGSPTPPPPTPIPLLNWQPGTVTGSSLGFPVVPANTNGDYTAQVFTTHVINFHYPTNTKCLSVFLPTDSLDFTAAIASNIYNGGFTATGWEVVDHNNVVQSQGVFSGPLDYSDSQFQARYLTIPPPGKLGWFRLRLIGPNIDANFGNAYGGTSFCIVAPDSNFVSGQNEFNPYVPPDSNAVDPGGNGNYTPEHGIFGEGPMRLSFPSQSGTQAAKIAAVQAIANQYKNTLLPDDATRGWTAMNPDSSRPHIHYCNFPNFDGTADDIACVTAAVAILGTSVYWEGDNEPDASGAAAFFVKNEAFYTAVKAGNASALVMSPCPTVLNNQLTTYLNQFFALGPHMDMISFHSYNSFQADGFLSDYCSNQFATILGSHSKPGGGTYATLPLFGTEEGDCICIQFGLQITRQHLLYSMHTILEHERWGCPNEHQCKFYDGSRGFWAFPSWEATGRRADSGASPYSVINPLAALPAMRTMTAQLRGKPFNQELNPGNGTAHDYARFYEFGSAGNYCTVIFTEGMSKLDLNVLGSSSVVDVYGNPITVTPNGYFQASDLPTYIQSTGHLNITDVGSGLHVASAILGSTPTVAAGMVTTDIVKINDGLQHSCYMDNQSLGGPNSPYNDTNFVMPGQATLTFPSPQTLKRVGIQFAPPYQNMVAPVKFHVEALVGTTWQQIYDYTNTTAFSTPFADVATGGTYETYYNCEWNHNIVLKNAIPNALAIRVTVTQSTYSSYPDAASLNVTFPQVTQQHVTIREITPFSS